MAQLVFTNAFVSVNGVDLSDHVKSVKLDIKTDQVDNTTMGNGTHVKLNGLKDWSASLEFAQDFAAGEVDATLWAVHAAGAAVPLIVRPVNAAASAANPQYSGNVNLESYSPIGGSVGDEARAPVSLVAAGPLARATA